MTFSNTFFLIISQKFQTFPFTTIYKCLVEPIQENSVCIFFYYHGRCAEKKYPEDLPTISVVLIYLDEALSVIKRAVRSIIDKTPARLLKEVVLVDDHSSNGMCNGRLWSTCNSISCYWKFPQQHAFPPLHLFNNWS